MPTSDLAHEWILLQNQFDSYEKHSLLIKLLCVALYSYLWLAGNLFLICLVVVVLWGLDAIWKTYQNRIEIRLLAVEQSLLNDSSAPTAAFQFNSNYLRNRPSNIKLIREYLHQAARPTVVFPYLLLILVPLLGRII